MRRMRRCRLSSRYDLAIAGSGFAGSLMAMLAKRVGLSVVLLEKGQHPRVVVGESSTPLSNLLLERLAQKYDLPWLEPFTKWGRWQKTYPEIACGLKRGFTFFHHELGRERQPVEAENRQLLVAASPSDGIADTHWFRADFDQFLVTQACEMGVIYLDHCDVRSMQRVDEEWKIGCAVDGAHLEVRASFVVDATGPQGLLHRALGLTQAPLPGLPRTSALYGHFKGVGLASALGKYTTEGPPYPPDAAAMHHVFDGGWIWVLHFNNGWTSAGVAAERSFAERFGFAEGQVAWERLLRALPEVHEQFADAHNLTPFTYVPQLSYRSDQVVGGGWAMLPSAAGFVDPLLSTGFPLTLLGVLRLGEIFEQDWKTTRFDESVTEYARNTTEELLATADLIGALYANMGNFSSFRALSLLYFAAASYAETVHRLGRPERARSFLLCRDPVFGPALRELTARARGRLTARGRLSLQQDVLALIEKFDVAGLTKQPTDHCYPVCADDIFSGAAKVGANSREIEAMLRRSGFSSTELSVGGSLA